MSKVAKQKIASKTVTKNEIQNKSDSTPYPAPVWLYALIFLIACLIYSNTVFNDYAIDDTMVITDNVFTKKGFDGIKDHFTHDAFVGFFGEKGANLVAGGRYRPLTLVTFSIEYGLFGKLNPGFSHFVNIFLYGICCSFLLFLLFALIPLTKNPSNSSKDLFINIPFISTLLFTLHPIHTEAVANIKGRDEIMVLLFSLLALWGAVRYSKTGNVLNLFFMSIIYFLALLSKENAITFLAIIPLTLFFFTNAKIKEYLITFSFLIAPAALFLIIRKMYTQAGVMADSPEILNNPFLNATIEERYATTILTFLRYFKLLIVPHPLTHDYYFNQIPFVKLNNLEVLFSLLITLILIAIAIINFIKRSLVSYAILFYFITFSVVSNVLFTVGVLMNERFVFMSSIGFTLIVAWTIYYFYQKKYLSVNIVYSILVTISCLYSVKTFTRNTDWKDNFTLFINDERWSPNSAKIQTSCGGDLIKESDKETDEVKKKEILQKAITHLERAVEIYPNHSNAWLLLGNAKYKFNNNPNEAMEIYNKAKQFRVGGYYDASFNLGCVLAQSNMPDKAIPNFLEAWSVKNDVYECAYNLAESYAKVNKGDSAIMWFNEALKLKPNDPNAIYQIGKTYGKVMNNLPLAIEWFKKAKAINPKSEVIYEDLGVAYGLMGRLDESIKEMNDLIAINPKYPPAYFNLFVSYSNKGDKVKARESLLKAKELNPQAFGNIPLP